MLLRLRTKFTTKRHHGQSQTIVQILHLDLILIALLFILASVGLLILFSASNKNYHVIQMQMIHLLLAFGTFITFAQIPPSSLKRAAVWVYLIALILLSFVLVKGHIGKGAQRWVNIGFMRFQPSELMKIGTPLILAWYYHHTPLPISTRSLLTTVPLILVPTLLIAKQPDLSTASLIMLGGMSVLFLAGLSYRMITLALSTLIIFVPFAWFLLHAYQKQRILTFLNPEWDPLGKGYHIIQSKIAIGSGGVFGKGLFNGTQSNLQFLPEHSTDFIFAVCSEEFGFIGNLLLMTLFVLIVIRGLIITNGAQDTFSRLLAGSITFTFFASFFINMGMVTGILPVMGIPLPLVSYGGSSMVTMMASFGMLMSIQTHRKLVTT